MTNKIGHSRIVVAVGERLLIGTCGTAAGTGERHVPIVAEVTVVRSRSIDVAIVGDAGKPISPGTNVDVTLARPSGIHSFRCQIPKPQRRDLIAAPTTLTLMLPSDGEWIQRRGDYRLPLGMTTQFKLRASEKIIPAWMENLSAGGALLTCRWPVAMGAELSVAVPMGVDGILSNVRAVVVDCLAQESSGPGRRASYSLRLCFDNGGNIRLADSEREEIVRYIFQQQRVMLRVRKMTNEADQSSGASASQKKTRGLAGLLAWMRAPSL